MGLYSRSTRLQPTAYAAVLVMVLYASTAKAQVQTEVTGPAPGSLLLLSTHKPGAVISSTQLQLPNISPTAPFWSSPANADAAMGIWDVADFVKELGAEPATAAFVAKFEPCLSPTCSGDGNSSMISGNIQITGGSYHPSSRTLFLTISSESVATTSLLFSGAPRTAMSVDLIIQRPAGVTKTRSYSGSTSRSFFPAMPTDDAYQPVWYDWHNSTLLFSKDSADNGSATTAAAAPAAAGVTANSAANAGLTPMIPSDAEMSLNLAVLHSLTGASLRPVSCKRNCTSGPYRLLLPTPDLLQELTSSLASAADGTGNRLDDIKQFVTTVQDYVLEQKAVPVLLQLRTAPEVVLNAPVLLQSISKTNTSKLSYTLTAEPGHSKQLLMLQPALRKVHADDRNTTSRSNNMLVQDASLKVLISAQRAVAVVGTLDCKEISARCPPPYLGTAFRALDAFPYSVPSWQPVDSGIGAPGRLQSDWLPNRSPFSAASIVEAATELTIDLKCDSSMSVSTYTSATELRRSWSTEAEVGAKFFGVTASASAAYKSVSSQLSSSKSLVTTSSIVCATHGYQIPPTLSRLELDEAFVADVTDIINSKYDVQKMYLFYQTYGTHFTKSVILGGYTTTTMRSSAVSVSAFQSSGMSIQASIAFGLASAKDKTEYSNAQNNTAQAQGWAWSAVEAPAGASLTWEKQGSSLDSPPVPNMSKYVKDLEALKNGVFGLSPIRYSLQQLEDVFKATKLWQPHFSESTGLNQNSLSEFTNRYMAAVLGCFANSGLSGSINCELDDLSVNGGCGSLGYPNPDTPEGAAFQCNSCLNKPTYRGSTGLEGCPYTSNSCTWKPNATATSKGPKAVFGCTPPTNGIWSFNPSPADTAFEPECKTYIVGQPLDIYKSCLLSPNKRYSFCLQWDADLLIKDLYEPNWDKQNLFSAYWDAESSPWYETPKVRMPGYPFFCQPSSSNNDDKQFYRCSSDWQKVGMLQDRTWGKQYDQPPTFYKDDKVKLCLTQTGRLTASAFTRKCVPFGISGEGALAARGMPDCTSDYRERKWQRYFESKNWDKGNQGPYTAVMQDDGNLVVYNKLGFDGRNSAWHGPWQN